MAQTLWEELTVPGVDPRLDDILAQLADLNDQLKILNGGVGLAALSGSSGGSLGGSQTPTSAGTMPFGLTFDLALPLQKFNELVGATAYPGALPIEVPLQKTIPSGAVNSMVQYVVPPDTVVLFMSGLRSTFSYHAKALTVLGFLNYGLAEPIPITEGPVPILQDFDINRVVSGSHELTGNLTLLFTNLSPYDVEANFTATALQVTLDTWKKLYIPIFRDAQRTWLEQIAAHATDFLKAAQQGGN